MLITDVLTDEEKKLCKTKKLSKGETLFHEADSCDQIGIVVKGKLHIISYPEDGKPLIYKHLDKEEIFGNNLIFSSRPYYKGDVIAEENSEVILINKEDLLKLMKENRDFLIEYLKIQSDTGKHLHSLIRILSFSSAEERFLYYMHENGGQIRIASVSDLADDLFLSRETLSRLLSLLAKQKRIFKDGKTIRLL